ncbi:MAG: DUF6340 family protein [Methylovulum sp.]|nr:DUF6340 family protein [Methylovulum sp.]
MGLSLIMLAGCAPKVMHSFIVDAPAKYPSSLVIKEIEVLPFEGNGQYGQTIGILIKSGISHEGYINVVPGAGYVVTGNLTIGDVYKNSREKAYECSEYDPNTKKSYKKTCYSYYHTKKTITKVGYILQDKSSGSTIIGDSFTSNFDRTWESGTSVADAEASASTDDAIITASIEELAQKVVADVTPHKMTVSRELQKGDDDNIGLGITYLEKGRADQAVAIWDQVINQSLKTEDKAAAYYNIGVVKESQGLYKDAFELYSKSNVLMPKEELYMEAMTRVEGMKKDEEKTRAQTLVQESAAFTLPPVEQAEQTPSRSASHHHHKKKHHH